MVPEARCALPVVVMKGEGDDSNPREKLAKNNVGICRTLPFAICFFFKLGKWLLSSGWINPLNINIYNIWRL